MMQISRIPSLSKCSNATVLTSFLAAALFGAALLATTSVAFAGPPCQGPGALTSTGATPETKCLTAVLIPGNPLRSYDISFVNPDRAEYYLADRSNAGIDIIDTRNNTFKRRLPGFVGVVLNVGSVTPTAPHGTVNNNKSGPDGVVTHGRWLYAGDGDSTVKVFDLNAPTASAFKQSISTVPVNQADKTRVDEMALTTDGELLLAANNAEDPPFATLFRANGDAATSNVAIITKVLIAATIVPAGAGLSIEQPAWDPQTRRFYTSIPVIANNPAGCNFGPTGTITCDGGLLVIDPTTLSTPIATIGAFDPTTNTGVVPLHACGPNGATVGPNDNLLLGCTPQNNPSNRTTLVINATTKNTATVNGLTGSDEVWFNSGDNRYYTGSSRDCGTAGTCPDVTPPHNFPGFAVLGVVDGTSVLIEKIPQSSGSHSVAADSKRNKIFVPQSAPAAAVGAGGDITPVGAGICGTANDNTGTGCVAVYIHDVDRDEDGGDHDRGRDREGRDHDR